ncbi:MAG: hypothetical protein WC222_05305 [Parachlamydiales bacterium]|jgi:hypothetical protein
MATPSILQESNSPPDIHTVSTHAPETRIQRYGRQFSKELERLDRYDLIFAVGSLASAALCPAFFLASVGISTGAILSLNYLNTRKTFRLDNFAKLQPLVAIPLQILLGKANSMLNPHPAVNSALAAINVGTNTVTTPIKFYLWKAANTYSTGATCLNGFLLAFYISDIAIRAFATESDIKNPS